MKTHPVNSTHLNVAICHSYVVGIGAEIFRSSHDGKLNGAFVRESFVRPFSHRSYHFDRGNAIVGYQDLFDGGFT